MNIRSLSDIGDIVNVVYPATVEPNTPFSISYEAQNVSTSTYTYKGHIVDENNNEIAGTYWEQSIAGGSSINHTDNFSGIATAVNWTIELYHEQPVVVCEDITNPTDCTSQGCYWYNNSCHTTAPTCESLLNQSDCETYGCYWWNGTCHSTSPTCESLNNATDCSIYGCYWYDNSCHTNPQTQPEICTWVSNTGGPSGITIVDVFQIIDSYIFGVPPSGYSFVPNIIEVFGIIDYYLGFISSGNTKTGCTF